MPSGFFRGWPRWRAPLGLLGALALISAIEWHVDQNALDYLGGGQWGYKVASQVAAGEAKRCGFLCFGDSLMKLSLAPKVVEAESGLRGYNLAQAGGQAPGTYFLLRQALDAGARPSAILVDFFPSLLAESPHFNDENWPLLGDIPAFFDLAAELGEPDEFARLAVARFLPSARCRNTLRFDIKLALQPVPISLRTEILRALRNWRANRGAEITASKPVVLDNIDAWEGGYFPRFRCTPTNRDYVERFLDLAGRHQIPVFWTLPPYQPQLQDRCERSGFDAGHEAFIRAIQARHPNLVVIDARHAGYEPGVFFDLHHLGREGAAVFSAGVGQALRGHLGEPGSRNRWIELPRYQARPEAAPLEDGDQSRRVVLREIRSGKTRNPVR